MLVHSGSAAFQGTAEQIEEAQKNYKKQIEQMKSYILDNTIDIFTSYKGIVDTLIVNGDLLDCFSCSAFPKKFKVNLDEELVLGRQYIIDLINLTTPKKVMFS